MRVPHSSQIGNPDRVDGDGRIKSAPHCRLDQANPVLLFSSPEPKALSELIGWDFSRRSSIGASVNTLKHEYL